MSFPELAKEFEGAFWERDQAVFSAFTSVDMDEPTGAIDVGDLKMGGFI